MKSEVSFNELLTAAAKGWCTRSWDEGILSIAIPLKKGVADPLLQLPLIASKESFRFLWDQTPLLCIAVVFDPIRSEMILC